MFDEAIISAFGAIRGRFCFFCSFIVFLRFTNIIKMELTENDKKLIGLHEETKKFLLDQIEEFGPNPLGQSLMRSQRIYQLVYWDGDGQSVNSKQIIHVGQTKTAGKDKDGNLIKVEVVSIVYDWLTSRNHGVPTHVIMARREGDKLNHPHVNRYVSSRNFEIVFNPPTEKDVITPLEFESNSQTR